MINYRSFIKLTYLLALNIAFSCSMEAASSSSEPYIPEGVLSPKGRESLGFSFPDSEDFPQCIQETSPSQQASSATSTGRKGFKLVNQRLAKDKKSKPNFFEKLAVLTEMKKEIKELKVGRLEIEVAQRYLTDKFSDLESLEFSHLEGLEELEMSECLKNALIKNQQDYFSLEKLFSFIKMKKRYASKCSEIQKIFLDKGLKECNKLPSISFPDFSSIEGAKEIDVRLMSGESVTGWLAGNELYFKTIIPQKGDECEYSFCISLTPKRNFAFEKEPEKFGTYLVSLAFPNARTVVPDDEFDFVTVVFNNIFKHEEVESSLSENGKVIYDNILQLVGYKAFLDDALSKALERGQLKDLEELMYGFFSYGMYLYPNSGNTLESMMEIDFSFDSSCLKRTGLYSGIVPFLNDEDLKQIVSLNKLDCLRDILGPYIEGEVFKVFYRNDDPLIKSHYNRIFIDVILQNIINSPIIDSCKKKKIFESAPYSHNAIENINREKPLIREIEVYGRKCFYELDHSPYLKNFFICLAAKGYQINQTGETEVTFNDALEAIKSDKTNMVYALLPMKEWSSKDPYFKESLVYLSIINKISEIILAGSNVSELLLSKFSNPRICTISKNQFINDTIKNFFEQKKLGFLFDRRAEVVIQEIMCQYRGCIRKKGWERIINKEVMYPLTKAIAFLQ